MTIDFWREKNIIFFQKQKNMAQLLQFLLSILDRLVELFLGLMRYFGMLLWLFGALWLLISYIIKQAWNYLLAKREEYIPDDFHIRFIDFVIYAISFKWMNKTQWIILAGNILMFLYHLILLGDWKAAAILQSSAFLVELAIAPAFEDMVRTIDFFIIRDGKRNIVKQMYVRYTPVFILFFVTTYFARLIILWQYSNQWGLNLTAQEVGMGMTNMFFFTISVGWIISLNVITTEEQKLSWLREIIMKTITAGREWYAFWNPANGN
jgi:hypothetical protein